MVTFRSGPRDPVTGRSSAVVSDPGNIVRASGQTDNERAARRASYTSYEPAAVQASERNARNEASYQQFLRDTGRTATNPYGNEGLFSRAFGISPDKLDYSGTTPGGIATLEKVNRLAFDQFMNPRDARGNIRGMLREGSPTRYGPVGYDPSQATDFGIMGALPFIGPMLQRATRRSGLTIFPEDYGDLGNELGDLSFLTSSLSSPGAEDADAPATATSSDVFEPFTTDPDVRNPESYFVDINTRPQETPVTPGFIRPDDATMPSVADVIAAEPMVAGGVDYDTMPFFESSRAPLVDPAAADARAALNRSVVRSDPRLPTGPKVIQEIPGGDPGSASITVNPQSESPTYTAPDEPVDLLQDILAPDGGILPGVMDVIGSSETDQASSAAPIFDIPQGGFPDPRVSRQQLTPEQVQRDNENRAAMRRRLQLMAEGMDGDAAMMQAEREKIRARAARLGLGQ